MAQGLVSRVSVQLPARNRRGDAHGLCVAVGQHHAGCAQRGFLPRVVLRIAIACRR